MKVVLVGFGTVGTGVARLLTDEGRFEGMADPPRLTRICDLDLERDRGVELPGTVKLDRDAFSALSSPDCEVLVELIGGTGVAFDLVKSALEAGKPVVTANKALLAERGRELFSLAAEKGLSIGFEAAVCGGIPLIRSLRSGLAADRVSSLVGIVNGTCNYILSSMQKGGLGYREALSAAREEGLAEADPSLDVEGTDSAHKLVLLAALAFGRMPAFEKVHVEGIEGLDRTDVAYAAELGYVVKLLAIAENGPEGMMLRVHPALVAREHPLASVSGAFNAVLVRSDAVGTAMFYGPGAGSLPTASAVVSDVLDVCSGTARSEFARLRFLGRKEADVRPFDELSTRYYMRFTVRDRFGVLGAIAAELGRNRVSIDSVVQKEARGKEDVPIVVLTHRARERDVQNALAAVNSFDFVSAPTVLLRVEDGDG